MAYWTTSGEFVFVAILSGTGSVAAPFLGSLLFECDQEHRVPVHAVYLAARARRRMLLVIMFLPAGLWSLFGAAWTERCLR